MDHKEIFKLVDLIEAEVNSDSETIETNIWIDDQLYSINLDALEHSKLILKIVSNELINITKLEGQK